MLPLRRYRSPSARAMKCPACRLPERSKLDTRSPGPGQWPGTGLGQGPVRWAGKVRINEGPSAPSLSNYLSFLGKPSSVTLPDHMPKGGTLWALNSGCKRGLCSPALVRSPRHGHLLGRRSALTSRSHTADSRRRCRHPASSPDRQSAPPFSRARAPTHPPWSGPGTESGAALCPNRGLRAAAERPLAFRKEPRRHRRGRRRESSAGAGGGGSREPNQKETGRQNSACGSEARAPLARDGSRRGPAPARPAGQRVICGSP